ncbi:hypothetical protein [Flavobacterium sp.]|jgi:hypothetical protein|uniref:hypothetical protein n=1 Tax=Flavobacterium sp. TaxID=239 RepID=UPI0037BF8F1B
MERETESRKRKVELVTLRAQVSRKTEVVTAVQEMAKMCKIHVFLLQEFYHNGK